MTRASSFILLLLFSLSAPAKTFELPIRYSKLLAGHGFPSPLVQAYLNGKSGVFLIDSGASVSVISKWFSDSARIRQDEDTSLGTSNGRVSAAGIAKVRLRFKNRSGALVFSRIQVVTIVALPKEFEDNGIAGILSPQQLLQKHETCVLNLSEPSLKIETRSSIFTPGSSSLEVAIAAGPGGINSILYTLPARLVNKSLMLIVDTGASHVAVGRETSVGLALFPNSVPTSEKVEGIDGKAEEVRLVANAELKAAGRAFATDIRIQPISKKMPADGMAGMQFLRRCTLFLSQNDGQIFCP